jgi:leucyl-tRNA synthetase
MKKMNGYEVLNPMGWDAFGLPAEQYALKNKIHPRIAVEKNIKRFKEQLAIIGCNYDWSKEVNTTDPEFYKWTQWIFKQMFKHDLAFQSHEPINWCPSCMTGLANEDLDGDKCERCGTVVEKKPLRQWVLKITKYADRMLEDLDGLNWPESIKESQRNWIGKSEGAEFGFELVDAPVGSVKIFTTRADTLYGATFVAISAELASSWLASGWNVDASVSSYVAKTLEDQKIKLDYSVTPEKTGIFSGVYAINPATKEKIPVWIANYVLGGVGTGAIMAVPAHDERDFDFAKKFNLPVQEIELAKTKEEIIEAFNGKKVTRYKLEDWVFARQRYWGEPFPIVFDENNTPYVVADSELPVKLPEVESYEPTGTGESPLANIKDWVEVYGYIDANNEFVSLDKSDSRAKLFKRETNTMPQWAGSSWYYLRYMDPNNAEIFADKSIEKKWSPVDFYVGGAEHATRHLIYARFYHKFLYDIGAVNYQEPFKRLQNVGLIQAEDGRKMSKRFGNVVNPDDVIGIYGADALRVYEMFMGPFDQSVSWSTQNMGGSARFLERFWKLQDKVVDGEDSNKITSLLHKTIKKVSDDIENFKFNTAISTMMILLNAIEDEGKLSKSTYSTFIQLLAPFAPHITEELWMDVGNASSVHLSDWPKYDESKMVDTEVTIALQISGKMRDTFVAPVGISNNEVLELAKLTAGYQKYVGENTPKKVIVVQNKLINVVI